MATLVLTAVGGAIGGPAGAALGALLGQQVDRALLGGGRGRQGPRLTELAVQTSSYGTQIPKVFGTMRVAGCVIWSTDLIETRSRSRAGKGQPTTTSYSYAASFAVALSARAITGVGRIWAEGKLLRGAAGDWKATTGFRLHTGGEDQLPDPLIASLEAAAPAHRGIAYAVFENLQLADFGNRIPSLTFEVFADAAPVSIGAVARVLGEGAIVGDGPADPITGFAASGSDVAGAVETLAEIAGAWIVPEGAAMRMANRIDAAVALDDDCAVTETRAPVETVPRILSLSHYDPARDFQIGTQRAERPGAGWREEATDMAVAIEATNARGIARTRLLRAEIARVRRRAVLDVGAIGIAPGAAVTLPGSDATWRVTQASVERLRVTLDLVAVSVAPAAGGMADPGRVSAANDLATGTTLIEVAELPPLDDAVASVVQVAVFAAGTGAGWRQAALLTARAGSDDWEAGGGTAAPATIGVLAGDLPVSATTLVDRRHAVEVMLAHDAMTLQAATAGAVDRGANLALVGDELIQFEDAVQIAPRRWRIGGLRRAVRATVVGGHAAGARFVLVERDTLMPLSVPALRPGDTLRVLASGTGDTGGPVEATVTLTGASIAPPAPVHLRWSVTADGGAVVTWVRRSRLGWRWNDGGDVPLAEEQELYAVTVGARTLTTAVAAVTVTPAERVAGAVTVSVRQIGTYASSRDASIIIEEIPV